MLRRSLTTAAILLAVLAGSTHSAAADEPTAKDLFAQGKKLYDANDFRAAADAFEKAYQKKPHHDALWNAARSWHKAGEDVRAANVYAKYLREAPAGSKDRDQAATALAGLQTTLGKIVLRSTGPDDLKIDDTPNDPDGLFVQPGEHVVSGQSGAVRVKKSINLAAGQVLNVTLDPPPPPPKPEPPRPPPKPTGFRMPWIVVVAGGVLALAGGGVTIWSGLDTNEKREAYRVKFAANTAPTEELRADIDEGRAAQFRTNLLLAATIGVTALTGVSALFVDWGGKSKNAGVGGAVAPHRGVFFYPSLGQLTIGYRH